MYLNYIRQSTEGWSIHGVILDVGGGVFSFLQMTIDAFNNGKVKVMHALTSHSTSKPVVTRLLYGELCFTACHYQFGYYSSDLEVPPLRVI